MLDENVLAKGRRGFSVSEAAVSLDHKLLAYAVDGDGSERNMLKVRDLATGRDLADTIPEVRGGAVWSADWQWLFYVGRDPAKWGQKVFRHRLGTPVAEDELVYEEIGGGLCRVAAAVALRSLPGDRVRRLLDHRASCWSILPIRPRPPRPSCSARPAPSIRPPIVAIAWSS